ncbi:tripartite tricarboxylate transporter TctB family protein [Acuticoccus sediminis]|uniref:tripartite tricarboxylate transporter TctB family protein n=1 Tax=Acuticoccus sediminis TaxID=2184697 RepID=UPI001CFD9B7E|nr:tripartite tricarboxylate transporter TctB family protein [Acuticoccus sediminis]
MQQQRTERPDWGHALLVLFFAGLTAFYLHDAWQASGRVRNLILILPASILSFILCAVVMVGIIRHRGSEPDAAGPEPGAPFLERYKPAVTMAVFGLYVFSLPTLGFDGGTAVFMAAMLALDGVRNPLMLIGLPVAFAGAVTLMFDWLLPYPMPLLIL